MPHKPQKPCAVRTCPGRASHGRYCVIHAKERQQQRPPDTRASAARRGYGRGWQRTRAAFLKAHKTCVICGAAAEQVDHIIPLAEGGTNQWHNLQAMCATHHSQKTAVVDGGFGNPRGGGRGKSGNFL